MQFVEYANKDDKRVMGEFKAIFKQRGEWHIKAQRAGKHADIVNIEHVCEPYKSELLKEVEKGE